MPNIRIRIELQLMAVTLQDLVQVCFWPFLSNIRLQLQINLATHLPLYNQCPSNRIHYTYFQYINQKMQSVKYNNARIIKTHFIRIVSLTRLDYVPLLLLNTLRMEPWCRNI